MKYIVVIPFCWVVPSKTADWQMDFPPIENNTETRISTLLNKYVGPLFIVGPKYTMAASHAAPWWVTVCRRGRQTDGRTPDRYIMLSAIRGMCYKLLITAICKPLMWTAESLYFSRLRGVLEFNKPCKVAALRHSTRTDKHSQPTNAWQSLSCSPPGANAPAKLTGCWTEVHKIFIRQWYHRRC